MIDYMDSIKKCETDDGDNDADGDDDDDGGGWSLIELSSQGVPRLASLLSDKPE